MRPSDFSRMFTEVVLCSTKPPNAFSQEFGVRGQTVTLWHITGLTPWTTLDEVVASYRDQMRREYRGPVVYPKGTDYHCPYCRNALVYECRNCGFLWCCPSEEQHHRCDWCKQTGPVYVPPGPPLPYEPYEPPSTGRRVWNVWLDFNEWVYDLMTRRNRPKTMREAEETYRKLKKP
jgi:hypothetical protein